MHCQVEMYYIQGPIFPSTNFLCLNSITNSMESPESRFFHRFTANFLELSFEEYLHNHVINFRFCSRIKQANGANFIVNTMEQLHSDCRHYWRLSVIGTIKNKSNFNFTRNNTSLYLWHLHALSGKYFKSNISCTIQKVSTLFLVKYYRKTEKSFSLY